MVYWHVETDYVALAIYIVMFVKAAILNRQKDFTDKLFSWALVLGIASTVIDIFSSTMMNERMGWWPYEISMIIYGLSVPVLPLFWFLYTVSLIFKDKEAYARRFAVFFCTLYAVYSIIIITNPVHELYFALSADIVYSRGAWFLPLIVGSQTVLSAIGILLLLWFWKRIRSIPIFFQLFFLYVATAASYYIQIANPGWLIVCSTYAMAFLVCDATFESQRRNDLYQRIRQSLEQLQEDKEKEKAYQEKLEKTVLEANQANQAKSEFLSRMSHDIRTPINGVRGMLEIIRKERHNEERVDDCLDKIEIASGNLLSLINDVLDMSKLESGEIVLTEESFDLRKIIKDCFSVLSQNAVDSGIKFEGDDVNKEVKNPYLIGSSLHIRQLFLNVVGNAIKYNKQGGAVYCTFEELEATDEQAPFRFTVRDTGIGISQRFLPNIFQPFAQEHAGSRTHYEGTGLGLAIVKKIIDRMGGEISVTSKVGEGSTFTFTIPFTIDPDPSATASDLQEVSEKKDLSDARLLIVEDNELNLEIAQFIVEEAGAEVDVALNGQEAVDRFADSAPGTYDAVLMDIMMPVMDGMEATRAIRAMDRPDAGTVPIIAMTANAFFEDVKRCHDAGMDAHLAKPISSAALIKVLAEHISRNEDEGGRQSRITGKEV